MKLSCSFHYTKNNYTDNNMPNAAADQIGIFYYLYDILHFPEELIFITIISCSLPNLFGEISFHH